MVEEKDWLSVLKKELSDNPLVSNVAFGFIQMALENMVELEFQCPCDPKWNALLSSAFFVIPAIMASTLMLIIEKCRCDAWFRITVSSSVPAIVWLILLFFDGRYFACAMTTWKGTFEIVDKTSKMKWCKPNVTSEELRVTTQEFYAFSQGMGMIFLLVICIGLIVYVFKKCCCQGGAIQAEGDRLPEELRGEQGVGLMDIADQGRLRGTI